jgi:hypothetical protein
MTTKAEWRQMAALCEIAVNPDKVLDDRIALAVYNSTMLDEHYTESTDAVFALIKHALPKAAPHLAQHPNNRYWSAALVETDPDGVPYVIGVGHNNSERARALLAAFCRAMGDHTVEIEPDLTKFDTCGPI